MDTLYLHALSGFQGQKGFMPPKGGRSTKSPSGQLRPKYASVGS